MWSAMTAVDTHTFNTSQKDRLFFSQRLCDSRYLLPSSAPIHFQAWQSWRELGIDGQPAAQDPTLPAPFLLELGGGKIIDSKLFLFFPAFLPSTLHADILWWNKSVPIEIPAETACYLLTRYLNCGLRGKLYGGALGNIKMSMLCALSLSAMEMELCPDALRTRLTDGRERAGTILSFISARRVKWNRN